MQVFTACSLIAAAQDPDSLPAYYGDKDQGTQWLRQNMGQIFDTDGDAVSDIDYYFENTPVGIYLRDKSEVSFTLARADDDTATTDTLYRIDMEFGLGRSRSPEHTGEACGGLSNYYRGASVVEEVKAYGQAVYRSVWDSINVYYYRSLGGPRMALVVLPGGDPADIILKFHGQDSIRVDWQGALHLYVGQQWIRLEEAMAYQVDDNNELVPVTWQADYDYTDGNTYVQFEFSDFDNQKPLVFQIGYPPMPAGGGGGGSNLMWSTSVGNDTPNSYGDYILGGDMLPDHTLVVTGNTGDDLFPANTGAIPALIARDVFVSHYDYIPGNNVADAQLLWTTFIIGGPAPSAPGTLTGHEVPVCIKYAADHDQVYVGGWTNSTEWPMRPAANPNDGSYYQSVRKGQHDGFILKLDPATGILERSTLYGGGGVDIITTIAADDFGRVHCFGVTDSPSGSYNSCNSPTNSDLPLCNPNTQNHQQDDNAGGLDIFVARFDEDFNLTWGSFIGGEGDDRVFDADYQTGPSSTVDRIALVGGTTDELGYSVSGTFQLDEAYAGETGFVWLLNSDGRTGWGTHIHGTQNLQGVTFTSGHVLVMGLTKLTGDVPVISSCSAASGYLSICSGEDELEYLEHYLAEFDLTTYDMKWSALQGGLIDASLSTHVPDLYITQAFDMHRLMDIRANSAGDFMYMGVVEQSGPNMISDYPTLGMWGMYQKPYDPGMGYRQTEIFISLRRNNKQLAYTTMFGSHFQHLGAPGDETLDNYHLDRGSDFGHDLLWADGEVLYLVGTTGGYQYDRQCPTLPAPVGQGYCELTAEPLVSLVDPFDGMIARFDLQDINIGMAEGFSSGDLLIMPNPASDVLIVQGPPDLVPQSTVSLIDATGRTVLSVPYVRGVPIRVNHLASGSYAVQVKVKGADSLFTARFIRQ